LQMPLKCPMFEIYPLAGPQGLASPEATKSLLLVASAFLEQGRL
jgi:hypothetical protein